MKQSIRFSAGPWARPRCSRAGLGCSHESRPAQAARRDELADVRVQRAPAGTPPAPPSRARSSRPCPRARSAGPSTGGADAHAARRAAGSARDGSSRRPPAAGESERQLCDALAGDAKLHVEDVQHGVAIVAVPRKGHDLSAIRDDAHRMESAMRRAAPRRAPAPRAAASSRSPACPA